MRGNALRGQREPRGSHYKDFQTLTLIFSNFGLYPGHLEHLLLKGSFSGLASESPKLNLQVRNRPPVPLTSPLRAWKHCI